MANVFTILFTTIIWLVVLSASTTGAKKLPQPVHPSCTNDMKGLPSCNFDHGLCGSYTTTSPKNLEWRRTNRQIAFNFGIAQDWQPSPTWRKGKFVSLDVGNMNVPVGTKARLMGLIVRSEIKAICLEFHYATTRVKGGQIPTITVYNRLRNGSDILIGAIQDLTYGSWKMARFHSCVGKQGSSIDFESQKLSLYSYVGLDYIKVTRSDMDCSGFDEEIETTTSSPLTTMDSAKNTPTATLTRGQENGATTEPPKPTTKKPTPPTQPTKTPTPPAQSTKHPTPPAQSTKHPTPPAQSTKKPAKQPYTPPMPRTHPKAPPVVEQAHPTTSFTGHDFYCDAATVFVYIPVRLLPNSKLTLQDNACVFDNNGTHYVIKFKFDQCGSSVEHSENGVIVTNKINVQKDLGEGFIAIEFDEDFKIPISCVMNRSAIFEGAIETVERDHIWEWEDKPHFNQRYRLRVFKTEEYLEDITDFPAQIPINREVFLQLSAADWNTDVGLQIEECFATPTEDVEDPVSYSLVRNGCPVSPAVHMVSSSTATRRRFKVQAFRFSDKNTLHNLVHFHCRVTYCRPESCTNASCTGSARNLRKRATRRDLDRGEYVTFGPLNVL